MLPYPLWRLPPGFSIWPPSPYLIPQQNGAELLPLFDRGQGRGPGPEGKPLLLQLLSSLSHQSSGPRGIKGNPLLPRNQGAGPSSCLGLGGQMCTLSQVPMAAEVAHACAGPQNGRSIGLTDEH